MMEKIVVKKSDLLGIVLKNKENHEKIYNESIEEYHKLVVDTLKEMLRKAESGEEYSTTKNIIKPVNNIKAYNVIIKALEMSQSENVELTQSEFNMYVMDDWGWKKDFLYANSFYSKTLSSSYPTMEEE